MTTNELLEHISKSDLSQTVKAELSALIPVCKKEYGTKKMGVIVEMSHSDFKAFEEYKSYVEFRKTQCNVTN